MFIQLRAFMSLQILLLCSVCFVVTPVLSEFHPHVHTVNNWSPVHAQNVLEYLSINATTFAPDQVYCPAGSLNDTYKQNTIFIGVLGCLDPFLLTLSDDNLDAIRNQSNDSCLPGLPGYYPPVSEYILALLMHVEEFNNRTDVLPYHKICIYSGIPLDLSVDVKTGFNTFIGLPITPVIVDVAGDQNSIFLQHLVLPSNIPLLRHSNYGNLLPVNGHTVWNRLSTRILNLSPSKSISVVKLAEELYEEYFFVADPDGIEVHYALLDLYKFYGWKNVAYILADDWSATRLASGFSRVYTGIDVTLYFFGYKQVDSDLLNLFKQLSQNELQVIVFHGTVRRYFDLLLEASRYSFVGPEYVWIFPYAGATFPDSYQLSNLWCGYTDEEVFIIKNALSGTLSAGISEGIFGQYDYFFEKFVDFSNRITGDLSFHKDNTHFPQTSRIYDIIGLLGWSLQTLVEEKASLLNTTQSMVNVSFDDRRTLASILHRVVLQSPEAVAGNLSFIDNGNRESTFISVRNFVPIENSNFSVNSSLSFAPWVVQVRACIMNRPADKSVFHFEFFDENGTSLGPDQNFVVFPSGSTAVPSDKPYRPYRRAHEATIISSVSSTLIFTLAVLGYVGMVYYHDKKREMYNSSWIFNEGDLHFISGERQQGIWGRLNNITKMMGIRNASNMMEEATKLNDGNIAVLIRLSLPNKMITEKMYQECNIMRDLKHPNICPFFGCLLNGAKSALLYKYYPRGTLKYVLCNSNIELQRVFRLSFALDISHGMEYLHSKKITHGRLETRNCVVDENWVVKVRNYGLEDLHKMNVASNGKPNQYAAEYVRCGSKVSVLKVAPEVRLLGAMPNPSADMFSFGHLLEELLVDRRNDWTGTDSSSKGTTQKEPISPNLFNLISTCLDNRPQQRPSFESVTLQLTDIALTEHNITEHGVMQIYSQQLEDRLEELLDKVSNQKDKQTEIMQHYIPKTMVAAIKDEKDVPITEHKNVAILCIELTCTELLSDKMNPESIEYLVLTMQKAIEGVTVAFDVKKIHSSGNMWILASGILSDSGTNQITEATNAAITVLDTFSGIFLPGLPYVHPTVRVGIHTGSMLCGVIEEPVPQLVTLGKSITTAINIASAGKDGQILASSEAGQLLKNSPDFRVTENATIPIQDELLPTVWIELTTCESISRSSAPQTLALPLDKNVTIKQCVRKHLMSVSSPSEPNTPLIETPPKKNRFNVPYSSYEQPTKTRRFNMKRSISLISNRVLPTNNPPKSRSPSIQSAKSSKLRPSVDSGAGTGIGIFNGSFESVSEGKGQPQKSAIARGKSAGSGNVTSDSLIRIRPWSANSEPARLIDMENLHGNDSPV